MNVKALKYLSVFALPTCAAISFTQYGAWTFSAVIFAFVLVPLIELLVGTRKSNLTDAEKELLSKDKIYDFLLYLVVPTQVFFMVWFLFAVNETGLSTTEIIGRISSAGMLCGVMGINVAHELGHRVKKSEQILAQILLLTTQYMHFFVEHNKGHHRNVATPEDPASAKFGENIYAFWPRTIVMSYISAWQIQNKERKRQKYGFFSFKNQMVWFTILQLTVIAGVFIAFDGVTVLYYIFASLIGILLLETVNYIEHYGLSRNKVSEHRYENVEVWHSWNSDHIVGRILLFELTRHSDHHFNAQKKYQILDTLDTAPQMPAGYPGMMVLSLFPPLFYKVMHGRIRALANGDK